MVSFHILSHDGSVGIATGCTAGVCFPLGAINYSLLHSVHAEYGAHPASYPMDTRGSFSVVNWTGHEANHSPPSTAEVKNDGAIPPQVIERLYTCWKLDLLNTYRT
jgi:hypothetical protein